MMPDERIATHRYQFSLSRLAVVVTVCCVVLAVIGSRSDLVIVAAVWGLACGLMGAMLGSVLQLRRCGWAGLIGGLIWFYASWQLDWDHWLSDRIFTPPIDTDLAFNMLFVFLLVIIAAVWALARPAKERFVRVAAVASLVVTLFLIPLFVYMHTRVRGPNFNRVHDWFLLNYLTLAALTVFPWLIAWRKRRLAGHRYDANGWDLSARVLATLATIVAPLSTGLGLLVLAFSPRSGWNGLGLFLLLILVVTATHTTSALLFLVALFIQWYRDRWQVAWLIPGCVYCLILWVILFFGE